MLMRPETGLTGRCPQGPRRVQPLDEAVYTVQPFAFCLAAEKPQVVVQLATPGTLHDNLSVPVTCDPPPAVLLGFKLQESCCDDTHARSGGIWTCGVLFAAGSAQSTGG